ncbi:MAG: DUF2508 family protein [Syntrophomonadaceae bacterium]|jgi:hypothetical protein|nr:DUF2508 family protein [Syntrophomonadaceae bacterium]
MRNCINDLLRRYLNSFSAKESVCPTIKKKEDIIEAQQYLIHAYNRFNNVLDPEMVEIAILDIKIAEKRYDYLIREMKNQTEGN